MDIDEVVGDFCDPIELPSRTMRWCLAHAEDVLPRFVDILRRHKASERCSAKEERSIFFVVHLLDEMVAPEPFPHIMDFVTGGVGLGTWGVCEWPLGGHIIRSDGRATGVTIDARKKGR